MSPATLSEWPTGRSHGEYGMLGIPRRLSHFVYAVLQSGLTCAIAAAIASMPFLSAHSFLRHWLQSWALSWGLMLPVVLFAAPGIRRLTWVLTRDDHT